MSKKEKAWRDEIAALPDVREHLALLGKTGKDKITGVVGVISSISFDLPGCIQVTISPPVDKDGKIPAAYWIDIHRVEILRHVRAMPIPRYAVRPAEHEQGSIDKPEPAP